MKNLFKFKTLNFVGNDLISPNSKISPTAGSANDQKKITSIKEVIDCNNDFNCVNTYLKSIILSFMLIMLSFNMNSQDCTSGLEGCLITSSSSYKCIGSPGGSITISQLIAGGALLDPFFGATTAQFVVIKGQVIADINYKFAFGSHIIFDVDHNLADPLLVNAHLIIETTTIQGCKDSWDRIKINPFGQLTLTSCNVYDAENMAVYPMSNSHASLSNNNFEKCYQGVVAEQGSFNHRIFQNTFKGGINMTLGSHNGEKPKLAISGSNSGLIIMKRNYFYNYNHYSKSPAVDLEYTSSDFYDNEFYTCERSIESKEGQTGAFAHLEQNDFNNGDFDILLETSAKLELNNSVNTETSVVKIKKADSREIEIDNNNFTFLSGGIFAGTSYGLDLKITNNSLNGLVDNNGLVYNFSEPIVLDLPFRSTGTVIDDNDIDMRGTEGCVGVGVQRSGIGTKIFDNRITAYSNSASQLFENTGILLFAADKTTINDHNVLKGNTKGSGYFAYFSTNSDIGCDNTFDDYKSGSYFIGFNAGVKLRDNEFTGNINGVHLGDRSTFIGKQVHYNNSWEDGTISPDFDILHESSLSSFDNQFVVSDNTGKYYPDPVSPTTVRAVQPGNFPYPCSPIIPPDFPQFGSPFPGEGFEWSYNYYRFDYIEDNPSLLTTDPLALAFYQSHENGPIGLLYDLEQEWLNLRTMDPTTQAAYDALIIDRDDHIEDMVVVSEDWGTNPTATNTALYNTLRGELDVILQSLATINSNNESLWLTKAATILSDISAVSTTDVPEQNYQDLLEIILENYISGASEWSVTHLVSLSNLSSQCSDDGGRAVNIARTLLGNPLSYDEDVLCGSSEPLSSDNVTVYNDLKIVPNPSNGMVQISWDVNSSPDKIQLYDMMGKMIMSKSVGLGSKTLNLDITELINGVYFVKMKNNNATILKQKLVLTK